MKPEPQNDKKFIGEEITDANTQIPKEN